jgi:hypothetical protein
MMFLIIVVVNGQISTAGASYLAKVRDQSKMIVTEMRTTDNDAARQRRCIITTRAIVKERLNEHHHSLRSTRRPYRPSWRRSLMIGWP